MFPRLRIIQTRIVMADECPVCQDALGVPEVAAPSTELTAALQVPGDEANAQHLARLKICGHVLHDACLKLWAGNANTCPICRAKFNAVEVLDQVGGMCLSHSPHYIRFPPYSTQHFPEQFWLMSCLIY